MKLAVVYPGVFGNDVQSVGSCAEAGLSGVLLLPELVVDESFSFTADPEELTGSLTGAGLEICGWSAPQPILTPAGSDDGVQHVCNVIDLADALRDLSSQANLPIVIVNSGNLKELAGSDRTETWNQLVAAMQSISAYAEERQVLVAINPVREQVVDRSRKALKLLGEVGSGYVQISFDPAGTIGDKDTLDAAAGRLKDNSVLAVARDVSFDKEGIASYSAPGKGMVNYAEFFSLVSDAPALEYVVVDGASSVEEAKAAAKHLAGLLGSGSG